PLPDPVHGPAGRPALHGRAHQLFRGLAAADLPRHLRHPPDVHGQVDHGPDLARHRRALPDRLALRLLDAERPDHDPQRRTRVSASGSSSAGSGVSGEPAAIVIGGGPAGLMAAERLAAAGHRVVVCDAMASVGRKFLLAGRGGLNITHIEPRPGFDARYGAAAERISRWLDAFGPDELRAWVGGLGIDTFVGTSGRVFPAGLKAAPLLRRWLQRLREAGVEFRSRHRWTGWTEDGLMRFDTPAGEARMHGTVVVLALGGASWPRLGSDGAWVPLLAARGIAITPLAPANCGFDARWGDGFSTRFAGHPLRTVAMSTDADADPADRRWTRGEAVITATGIEGGLVYALAPALRDAIAARGEATVLVDLLPDREEAAIAELLARPAGGKSLANRLRARLRLDGVKAGLLREGADPEALRDPAGLAARIKALP